MVFGPRKNLPTAIHSIIYRRSGSGALVEFQVELTQTWVEQLLRLPKEIRVYMRSRINSDKWIAKFSTASKRLGDVRFFNPNPKEVVVLNNLERVFKQRKYPQGLVLDLRHTGIVKQLEN